jgi:uncharacterized membrane protein
MMWLQLYLIIVVVVIVVGVVIMAKLHVGLPPNHPPPVHVFFLGETSNMKTGSP